jgi:SlyX protein
MQDLEEKLAHVQRVVDDLSDVVARQDREIGRLRDQVDILMRRESERERAEGGGVHLGDERPPHY